MKNSHPGKDMEVPKSIQPFVAKCPPLLPGESETQYYALFDLLMDELRPDTTTEWLALADITSMCWDIGRYRAWKGAILNIYRRSALESALRETHPSRGQGFDVPLVFNIARKEAEAWETDPAKRQDLDVRLVRRGYDEVGLNAGALLEGMEPLAKIERFLSSARGQLNAMLKEVLVRREFAARARKALDERLKVVMDTPKPSIAAN